MELEAEKWRTVADDLGNSLLVVVHREDQLPLARILKMTKCQPWVAQEDQPWESPDRGFVGLVVQRGWLEVRRSHVVSPCAPVLPLALQIHLHRVLVVQDAVHRVVAPLAVVPVALPWEDLPEDLEQVVVVPLNVRDWIASCVERSKALCTPSGSPGEAIVRWFFSC